MDRLAGKVALISGGARGQGATETRLFVREGAAVVFGDVLDDDGKKVEAEIDRKSTRLNSSHLGISYAVFCLKKKKAGSDRDLSERSTQDQAGRWLWPLEHQSV